MINARAEGGAYYRVIVAGQEWSRHTTDYKAGEVAYDVALSAYRRMLRGELSAMPEVYVDGARRVYYEPDPDTAPLPVSEADPPVTSEGGLDLIDFLARNTTPPGAMAVIEGETYLAAIQTVAVRSCATWRPVRIYASADGEEREWIGLAWRGYVWLFLWRDPDAIRIGGGV